jgi:hypothetical protein
MSNETRALGKDEGATCAVVVGRDRSMMSGPGEADEIRCGQPLPCPDQTHAPPKSTNHDEHDEADHPQSTKEGGGASAEPVGSGRPSVTTGGALSAGALPAHLRETLRAHYLAVLECDHERKQDRASCSCSAVALPWCASVGAAVDSWIEHVAVAAAPAEPGASATPRAELGFAAIEWEMGLPSAALPPAQPAEPRACDPGCGLPSLHPGACVPLGKEGVGAAPGDVVRLLGLGGRRQGLDHLLETDAEQSAAPDGDRAFGEVWQKGTICGAWHYGSCWKIGCKQPCPSATEKQDSTAGAAAAPTLEVKFALPIDKAADDRFAELKAAQPLGKPAAAAAPEAGAAEVVRALVEKGLQDANRTGTDIGEAAKLAVATRTGDVLFAPALRFAASALEAGADEPFAAKPAEIAACAAMLRHSAELADQRTGAVSARALSSPSGDARRPDAPAPHVCTPACLGTCPKGRRPHVNGPCHGWRCLQAGPPLELSTEELAAIRRCGIAALTETSLPRMLDEIERRRAPAPDPLRTELRRLAGEFATEGSRYERGGNVSGAANLRRVSNLLYALEQSGTAVVFTPVPEDEAQPLTRVDLLECAITRLLESIPKAVSAQQDRAIDYATGVLGRRVAPRRVVDPPPIGAAGQKEGP